MIILNIRIVDRSKIRGLGHRMRKIYKQVLIDAAHYWHRHILRRHWTSAARAQYGYKPRTEKYTRWKRKHGIGQGKFLDLWLTGQSRRWLLENVQTSATSGRVTLRMRAPWYFKNPNGQIVNARQKKFSSRRQPEKAKEVTSFNDRDRRDVRNYCGQRLAFFINTDRADVRVLQTV